MRASFLAAGLLGGVLWLAPCAAAQQGTTGAFGGGALRTSPSPAFAAGNMVIGLRSLCPASRQASGCEDGSSVQVEATVVGRCASGTFSIAVPVAADGTFSATGAVQQARTITRYELRGTLSESPSGTVTARFERATNARTRRCSAIDVAWQARRPPAGFGEPLAIPAGAVLLGATTRDEGGRPPLGIALRVSPDGRSVARAIYGVRLSCLDAGTSPTFDLPRADLPIGPDGRVSDRESGTVRTESSILKYVERFAATLGSTGATGMYSVELSVRSRATGKRVTRCRSGEVRWSAAA